MPVSEVELECCGLTSDEAIHCSDQFMELHCKSCKRHPRKTFVGLCFTLFVIGFIIYWFVGTLTLTFLIIWIISCVIFIVLLIKVATIQEGNCLKIYYRHGTRYLCFSLALFLCSLKNCCFCCYKERTRSSPACWNSNCCSCLNQCCQSRQRVQSHTSIRCFLLYIIKLDTSIIFFSI